MRCVADGIEQMESTCSAVLNSNDFVRLKTAVYMLLVAYTAPFEARESICSAFLCDL